MKLKKSQITMLIIIGLVIFIAVSLVLYITKLAVNKQSQQSVKKTQVASFETQPIKEFVTQCLDKLAKEAVILLGKQGGRIYIGQGGLTDYRANDEGYFFVKNQNYNVSYNIQPQSANIGSNYANPWKYPWETFPYTNINFPDQTFTGYFGRSTLPPLNPSEGKGSTMQSQIESYINSNIVDCTNFGAFSSQGIEIVSGKPSTSVIIGNNDITANLNYSIKIKTPSKEFTELNDFSTKVNVRLKDIYFFTKPLIENDITDITFKMNDDKNNRDSFKVRIVKDIYDNPAIKTKADLVIITDEKSSIGGSPFEYVFARINRAPALYYITTTDNLEFDQDYELTRNELLHGQQLKAEDPDEDNPVVTIKALLTPVQTLGPSDKIILNLPQIKFMVEATDGFLTDFQEITVKRK